MTFGFQQNSLNIIWTDFIMQKCSESLIFLHIGVLNILVRHSKLHLGCSKQVFSPEKDSVVLLKCEHSVRYLCLLNVQTLIMVMHPEETLQSLHSSPSQYLMTDCVQVILGQRNVPSSIWHFYPGQHIEVKIKYIYNKNIWIQHIFCTQSFFL